MLHFLRTLRLALCLVVPLALVPRVPAGAAETHYVTTGQVDLGQLLAPPPAPGSAEERNDLDAVIDASKNRSTGDAEQAHADGTISVLRFADVLGAGFSAENLPFALPFFAQVASDAHAIVGVAKVDFDRLRPFIVDHRISPISNDPEATAAPHHRSGSYPSGHATFAYVTGILLAAMVPEKATEIFARAAVYAHHRLIAGVHYPTDIDAGRLAGTVIANVLLHDPRFLADFAKARSEVRRAAALG
jgi:acid phosphatase (class A)